MPQGEAEAEQFALRPDPNRPYPADWTVAAEVEERIANDALLAASCNAWVLRWA